MHIRLEYECAEHTCCLLSRIATCCTYSVLSAIKSSVVVSTKQFASNNLGPSWNGEPVYVFDIAAAAIPPLDLENGIWLEILTQWCSGKKTVGKLLPFNWHIIKLKNRKKSSLFWKRRVRYSLFRKKWVNCVYVHLRPTASLQVTEKEPVPIHTCTYKYAKHFFEKILIYFTT